LKSEFPSVKGFSPRDIKYVRATIQHGWSRNVLVMLEAISQIGDAPILHVRTAKSQGSYCPVSEV
jgi:hypothetical protein